MTAVNLMGAMTEDSGRGRERNTVYKPSATYPQGREGKGRGGGGRRVSASSPPSLFLCLSLAMIVVCLLACFFICSYFLLPVHIIFFFLQSHYLSVSPYDRIFNYATVLPLYISPRSSFPPVHCGEALWGRSAEKSRRRP